MKSFLAMTLLLSAFIVGCSAGRPKDITNEFMLPKEMEGCKIIKISDGMVELYVIIQDDKVVGSQKSGKNTGTVIYVPQSVLIDGKTYSISEIQEDK